jgi:hypothetical protein
VGPQASLLAQVFFALGCSHTCDSLFGTYPTDTSLLIPLQAIDRIVPRDLRFKARTAVMDSIHDVFWLDFLASIVGLLFAMILLMSTAFPEEDQDDDSASAV